MGPQPHSSLVEPARRVVRKGDARPAPARRNEPVRGVIAEGFRAVRGEVAARIIGQRRSVDGRRLVEAVLAIGLREGRERVPLIGAVRRGLRPDPGGRIIGETLRQVVGASRRILGQGRKPRQRVEGVACDGAASS